MPRIRGHPNYTAWREAGKILNMHKGKQLTKTQIKENLLYYQKILEEIILNNKKYNRPSTIKLRSKPYKPSNKKKVRQCTTKS